MILISWALLFDFLFVWGVCVFTRTLKGKQDKNVACRDGQE